MCACVRGRNPRGRPVRPRREVPDGVPVQRRGDFFLFLPGAAAISLFDRCWACRRKAPGALALPRSAAPITCSSRAEQARRPCSVAPASCSSGTRGAPARPRGGHRTDHHHRGPAGARVGRRARGVRFHLDRDAVGSEHRAQGGAHEDEDVDRWAEEDGEERGVSASPDDAGVRAGKRKIKRKATQNHKGGVGE